MSSGLVDDVLGLEVEGPSLQILRGLVHVTLNVEKSPVRQVIEMIISNTR